MQLDLQRTIVAVSSGIASAQRAIVRLSGQQTAAILERLIVTTTPEEEVARGRLLESRRATYAPLRCRLTWAHRSVSTGVYFWPDSRSFTGEACAEIHLLGALPIVEALVEKIISLGAAPADRGEFTLRSFLAGKIDLAQAEAVLGVIEADATDQLQWALEQLAGNLSRPVRELRNKLLELIAHLEAGLDFVEEDIEFISEESLCAELDRIRQQLQGLSKRLESRGTRLRTSEVVLLGLPNAGKSSLFNGLVGNERAIVTEQAGTTRDAITEIIELDDGMVALVDTAGMEELQSDSPRAMAQQVLKDRLSRASAAILCLDLAASPDDAWIREQLTALQERELPVLVVGTKGDLVVDSENSAGRECDLHLSCRCPHDLARLRKHLQELLASNSSDLHSTAMHRTMIRCKTSIDQAKEALDRGVALIEQSAGEELVASELRCALDDLSCVIGEVHTEDILGEIFSRFCIGK